MNRPYTNQTKCVVDVTAVHILGEGRRYCSSLFYLLSLQRWNSPLFSLVTDGQLEAARSVDTHNTQYAAMLLDTASQQDSHHLLFST